MIKRFGLLIVLCLTIFSNSFSNTLSDSTKFYFPNAWVGKWSGMLEIRKAGATVMNIPMQLHIFPSDSANCWQWKIIYMGEKTDERDYKLIRKKDAKAEYILDENNSIVLDFLFDKNTFYSIFSVAGNLLYTTYTLKGKIIDFNIVVVNEKKSNKSGGSSVEIPEVTSYSVLVTQHAILKRVK